MYLFFYFSIVPFFFFSILFFHSNDELIVLTCNHFIQYQTNKKKNPKNYVLPLQTGLFYIIGSGNFSSLMLPYGSFYYLMGQSISTLHPEIIINYKVNFFFQFHLNVLQFLFDILFHFYYLIF